MTETIARKWVGDLRREVCREDGLMTPHVVRVQWNFQYAAYFHRYREFIQQCVLRSAQDFRATGQPSRRLNKQASLFYSHAPS